MRIIKDIYYDYEDLLDICNKMCDKYDFLKSICIGKTCCDREIRLLRIGKGKECALYCGAMHGNESITATILLKLIEDICICVYDKKLLSGIDINRMLKYRSFVFVPMSNPDGCEISRKGKMANLNGRESILNLCDDFSKWKSNALGVDINRNFDADWERTAEISSKYGFAKPSYMKFCGKYPHSELETISLVNLCKAIKPHHLVTLHTQGEVIYYGWKNSNQDEARLANILAMLCGYSVEIPEELSQGGGFKDWFSKTYGKPAFTIECGKGENPLPESEITSIYKRIFETLAVSLII